MRTALSLVLLFGLLRPAAAADFMVEDDTLAPPPSAVAAAIQAQVDEPIAGWDDKPCRFIGKPVDLAGAGSSHDWVLTTADACAWAASAAPIWVVAHRQEGYAVVLHHLAYDLTIGTAKSHGLRHIATGRATASRVEMALWKFDGDTYRLASCAGCGSDSAGLARDSTIGEYFAAHPRHFSATVFVEAGRASISWQEG